MTRIAIVVIAALATACAQPPSSSSARPTAVTVTVTGIPNGTSVGIWQTHPASGGGYIPDAKLGTTSGSLDVTVPVGSFVEASPVGGAYEQWTPERRFQEVTADTKTLTYAYVHEFSVTISTWSHGGTGTGVMGTVTPGSGWYRDGQTVTFTASPSPGFKLAHWGLFADGTAENQDRDSGTDPTFMVTVKRDFVLAAGFVPVGTP